MTQVFDQQGRVTPVTVLQAGPCVIVDRRTKLKHGYDAVQIGLVEFVKPGRISKPRLGQFKKAAVEPSRFVRELRFGGWDGEDELKPGDRVLASDFAPRQKVDVIGTSKGRGFQGVIKRHGFAGGPDTHGSMTHRVPGSIGASSYPSRVIKGTRMGGRHGGKQVTVSGLEIVDVAADDNLILVRGAVPGPNGRYVVVRRSQR